ncbi:hypothetical protein ABTM89_19935, partial [Acinetobacter baumannii]
MDDDGRLAELVRNAARVRFGERGPASQRVASEARSSLADRPRLIAIGSSTGGVEALQVLLGAFPVDCPPTV